VHYSLRGLYLGKGKSANTIFKRTDFIYRKTILHQRGKERNFWKDWKDYREFYYDASNVGTECNVLESELHFHTLLNALQQIVEVLSNNAFALMKQWSFFYSMGQLRPLLLHFI